MGITINSGIGSGLDTEALIKSLVQASSEPVSQLKNKASQAKSAVTALSDLSGLLSKLKSATAGLQEARDVAGFKASASDEAGLAVSANGLAQTGQFDVVVERLAKAHRSYSEPSTSSTTPMGQSGTIDFTVGGTTKQITLDPADTMEQISAKINATGLRLSASIFNSGNEKRLQIRGLDTGDANGVTMVENGTTLGLNKAENRIQAACDSKVLIDGMAVTRPDNQVAGAIEGVTLALKKESPTPITVDVSSDPTALKDKLKGVVDAFNNVVSKIHLTSGWGSVKANTAALAGDSTLRNILTRMSNAVLTPMKDTGTYSSVASIGLNFQSDGSLKLDEDRLSKALAADPTSVSKVLAGTDTKGGVMDLLNELATSVAERGKGSIAIRQQGLETRSKSLNEQADRETERLNRYADALRKQFTAMDTRVAASNNLMNYIGRF
ncbi:MAG: flagellar filament capping protein FliD [Myxococcota bacterium]|jgi:flagellar hook-associated protein 2|nr:flagellar filament capping protein FliD [Myxococcota bacterium]